MTVTIKSNSRFTDKQRTRLVKNIAMSLSLIVLGLSLAGLVVALFDHCERPGNEETTRETSTCSNNKQANVGGVCEEFVGQQLTNNGVTFSTKTGYVFTEENVSDETTLLNKCTVAQVYGVYRHGTRSPTTKYVKGFNKLQESLETLVNSMEHNELMDAVRDDLMGWTNPFQSGVSTHLTDVGMKEQYCLAQRFKKRFSGMFEEPYSPQLHHFQSTYKERTIQSAMSFAHGLFGGEGPLNGYQPFLLQVNPKNDSILRFFDACDAFVDYKENETVKDSIKGFGDTSAVERVLSNIQRKIDPESKIWAVSLKEVELMYRVCAMETASYGGSRWCGLFSKEDIDVFEYWTDLKQYVLRGYQNELNWRMSCKLFDDIKTKMTGIVNETPSTPKLHLSFAHAETLIPMVAALGLFKDNLPLTSKNYADQSGRAFRCANFSLFSGNLNFVLYRCTNDHTNGIEKSVYKFRVVLNERAVPLNHSLCDAQEPYLCSFSDQDFATILNDISSTKLLPCTFSELCSN